MGSPLATSRQDMMTAKQTHKSKYTSSSKLTQSQLYRTLSGTDLREKKQQIIKMRDTET